MQERCVVPNGSRKHGPVNIQQETDGSGARRDPSINVSRWPSESSAKARVNDSSQLQQQLFTLSHPDINMHTQTDYNLAR